MEVKDVDLNNPAHPGHSEYLISSNGRKAEQIFFHEIPLPEKVRSELLSECFNYSLEHCGFITIEFDLVRVHNSHQVPQRNFYMDEADAGHAIDEIYQHQKSEILGVWHTHPNGYPWPTPRDLRGWPNPALNWRYFLVTRGDVTEWRLVDD